MRYSFYAVVLLSLNLWGQYIFAFQHSSHPPYIYNLTYQDGLEAQFIYDLFVNEKGLLLLGTDQGLMSYNGSYFQTYPFKNSLSPAIDRLQQDNQGKLWCKNFSDQIFYFENDTLISHNTINSFLNKRQENLVDFLVLEAQLYFITEKNIYVESKEGHIKQLHTGQNEDLFFKLYCDTSSDRLFVLSDNDIREIKNDTIINYTNTSNGQKDMAIVNDKLFYFLKGNQNKLYLGDKEINVNISRNQYFYNLIKTDHLLWLCTSNGLIEIDHQTESIENEFLTGNRINDIAKDFEGNYWISSIDNGLFFMPNKKMKVISFKDNNLSQNYTAVQVDSLGHIFIGTTKGEILQLDRALNLQFVYKTETAIEINYIYLYQDKIITSSGVFERNKSDPLFNEYLGKDICKDEFGNFLIANYNSAYLLSSQFQAKIILPEKMDDLAKALAYSSLNNNLVFRNKRSRAVHYSKADTAYYVGFSDGLYKYRLDGEIEELKTPSGKKIIAKSIKEDDAGIIWIATSQSGLIMMNGRQPLRIFNTNSGLSSNACKAIEIDQKGVWVLTDKSLDLLDRQELTIDNLGHHLGLKNVGINTFMVDNQYVWLATKLGLIYFLKDNFRYQPKPYLEIIAQQNDGSRIENNSKLPYDKNNLLVSLNSILFKSSGDYTYEYILEPFHKEWQIQDAVQNQLNFVSLSPNNYNLKVRIRTGSFLGAEKVLSFSVLKPFWAEQWFVISAFLLLCLLLFVVYKWAVARTQKIQTVKEKLAISQLTALRSQMNPHFMFNILNAVQGLIYTNQKNKANSFIGTFSTLMRKTLDVSGKREISIKEELETIQLYISLEKARFDEEDFQYEFRLPEEDLSKYTIPSLVIQPFVENAIKHGLMHKSGQKYLAISLSMQNNMYWVFSIEDNGIGRKKSMEINQKTNKHHKSFAMNAIYERIRLINKLNKTPIKIEIEDLVNSFNQPAGTKVKLYIPVNYEDTNS